MTKFDGNGICKRCRLSIRLHRPAGFGCPDQKEGSETLPRPVEILRALEKLYTQKNTDYARDTAEGPTGNFVRVAQIMRLYPGVEWSTPFGVAVTYMLKQLDAGLTLISQKRESVTGEPIASRLTDVALYAVLGIVLDEESKSKPEEQQPKLPGLRG